MTEQSEPKLPDLKPLDEDILPPGLRGKVSMRNLRLRARNMGLCFRIGRRVYVTQEQLAELLESYRLVPRVAFMPRQLRARFGEKGAMDRVMQHHRKSKPTR
jgi:hypothetical protein